MDNNPQQMLPSSSTSNKIKIIIKSLVVDIISIVAMFVISLTALNYLNIIKVSQIFPFLAFLPAMNQKSLDVTNTQSLQPTKSTTPPAPALPEDPLSNASVNRLKQFINSGTVEQVILSVTYKTAIDQISKNKDINNEKDNVSVWTLRLKANNRVRNIDIEESKNNKISQLVDGVNKPISVADLKVGDVVTITSVVDVMNHNQEIETVIVRTGQVAP